MVDQVLTLKEAFEGGSGFGKHPSVCPHCGITVLYKPIGKTYTFNCTDHLSRKSSIQVHVGVCPQCNKIAIGAYHPNHSHYLWPPDVWPDRAPAGLDSEIKRYYDEARHIVSLSPSGAAVLSRRCIQHVIRKKLEIRKRSLFEEIEEAVKRDELSKPTRDALDHVRNIGNWAAHPVENAGENDPANTLIEVSLKEARYTLEVLELLFRDLYELPEKVERMDIAIQTRRSDK